MVLFAMGRHGSAQVEDSAHDGGETFLSQHDRLEEH